MPLLKRKPYILEAPPPDLQPEECVFQVRHTKEIFRDYEAYLSHIHLYRRRLWTCKVTGKQNLTYEEALVSERKATEQVQHFPKEFMGPVLSMVQFSPLRTDELIDRVYKEFKDRFVLNEEVFGKSSESFCPCKILKVLQPSPKGENMYEVGWLDEHGKRSRISAEPAVHLMRKKHPFTRALLKAFIREAAVSGAARNSVWFVKNKLARKYKISREPPPGISAEELRQQSEAVGHDYENVVVVQQEGQNNKKRRVRNDGGSGPKTKTPKQNAAVDTDVKPKATKSAQKAKNLREDERTHIGTHRVNNTVAVGATGDSKSAIRPVGKVAKTIVAVALPAPAPPPIKYPIEDSWVKPGPDDPVFSIRPLPSTDFFLPMECLGNILMIWDFCTSFSKALHLSPFSLEEFEKSLEYRDGNAPLIAEILFALLRTALSNPVLWDEFVKVRKRKREVSINTWTDDLSDLLQLTSVDHLGDLLPLIRKGCYKQFDIAVKLEILLDLVDRSLTSGIIRSQIDENVGEHQALSAKKREEDVESTKRRKQEKLKLQTGAANEGVDANGKSHEDGIAYEASLSADQNDNSNSIGKSGLNTDVMGDDEQNVGWKTKGKRKLPGSHSPVRTIDFSKKEEQPDVSIGSKSKKAYVKQEGLKQAELEKTVEENRNVPEKKRGHLDISTDCTEKEQIALMNQKRQEHLDRELEKRSIRTTPLGKDRDFNVYWFFPREGRLFVEDKDSKKWGYYSAKEEFEDLLHSLNPKGIRERSLQKQLEKHQNKICNVLSRRSKEISQRIALDEVVVRRSVRVRSAPRLPAFMAYVNKLRQS